ncbi:uncharacterized protein TNCV_2899201 [Trichonephila clavipes]|nr:uncharacterized protein TNCV_2899201 [Trichonephila clavipes]
MSGVKKKLSGSQKQKIRKEKEYNINSKYAKLDNFLISASSSSCASASSSNARELDMKKVKLIPGFINEEFGNPQMARIVRHNDESVREGYIRNGGKEVKLFTSALKAFQCIYRIVMAQRKHLDDFLRGRIFGWLECRCTQLEVFEELGITHSVISRLWKRFQDDGNVSRCYITGRPRVTTPNEDRYLAVTAKKTDGAQHQTCLVSSLQLQVRQFQGRLCTDA